MTGRTIVDPVEISLESAKTLVRALRYAEDVPALAPAVAELVEGIRRAERGSGVFDRLRRGWDEGFARGSARARGAALEEDDPATLFDEPLGPLEPRPQWGNVAKAIRMLEGMLRGDVKATSDADMLQAYVRDTYDALGISVRDERSLYVAITTASLLVELSSNGLEKGIVEPETVAAVAQIAQSFAASLIPYLPPEARA